MRMKRRTFLKASCASVAAAVSAKPVQVFAQAETADLVLTNGVVLTMGDRQPTAAALAVKGQRVLAVGSEQQVAAHVGEKTQRIDLQGKTVTPSLIDSHSHLISFGQMELMYVILRPPKVTDFHSLKNALAAAAKDKPPGEWIVGRGFQEFKEGRFPKRWELDEAVPNHPVLIIHWGGQFGVANTLALKKADLLDAAAKDPYGGKFLRDKSGVPDGVLIHYPAIYSVYKPPLTDEDQVKCARWGIQQFLRLGVTCVHDNFIAPQHAATYVRMERMGEMPLRIRVYPYMWSLEQTKEVVARIQRYRGAMVRLQGIKLAVDGYALMYDVPEAHRGLCIPMHPQDLLNEIVATIHKADFQVAVHAMGDKGVDWTLEAFSKAAGGDRQARDRRHRIEHFPFRKADSIKRAADMGVVVSTQPTFPEVRAEELFGKLGTTSKGRELIMTLLPLQTFLRQGVHVAFGADVPAFPSHSPLDSLRGAVARTTSAGRRLDPSESLGFLDALRVHTVGGAWAAFDENDLGTLEPGKLADLVVWNADLRQVKMPADVSRLEVAATYVGGKQVYAKEQPKA